jgi:methylmalonyl-CoA/ethylmalonyl-CoA epimerase
MAKVIKLNHIAIAIPEIEGALGFWQDALGLKLDHVEDVPSQKAQVGFLPVGESEIGSFFGKKGCRFTSYLF